MSWKNSISSQRRARLLARRERIDSKIKKEEGILIFLKKEKQNQLLKTSSSYINSVIAKKAPKLLDDKEYVKAIDSVISLVNYDWAREPADWEPKGKGRNSLYLSLVNHIAVKYTVPVFFLESFFNSCNHGKESWPRTKCIHNNIVIRIANGESTFKVLNENYPLTRKMAHDFLNSKKHNIIEAIRDAQLKSFNGQRLLSTVFNSRYFNDYNLDLEVEKFKSALLQWLSNQAMLDTRQIGPMIDYLMHRYAENNTFSMKGRTAISVIRDMEQWHNNLIKAKSIPNMDYKPSVFMPFELKIIENEREIGAWKIDEILRSKDLLDEGKKMRHCVASYHNSILSGSISIWTLTKKDMFSTDKCLTIEVRNNSREIVQARGVCNTPASGEARRVMAQWAAKNSLRLSSWL